MNTFKKLSPHGAILIANMFFVFYGIDRVNTAMNFINNGYTKALMLILCILSALNLLQLLRFDSRRRGGNLPARLIPMGINALLAIVTPVILLVDVCAGDRAMPFLNGFVKLLLLVLCIAAWINSARLIAAERRAAFAALNRRRAAPPRRPARYAPAPYARRTPSGYDRPAPRSYSRPVPRYDDRDLQGYSGRFAPSAGDRGDLRYSRDNRTGQPNRYPRSTRFPE